MDETSDALLERAEIRQSVDGQLRLVCEICGTYLCDVEVGDTIAVLARTYLNHDNNWH
jgi:hypothetical protein